MKLFGTAAATLGAIGCVLIVLEFVFKWGLVVDAVLLPFLIGGIVLRIYANPKKSDSESKG